MNPKNRIFIIFFSAAVVFFSLWLKEPVEADLDSCNEDCDAKVESFEDSCAAIDCLTDPTPTCVGKCVDSKNEDCEIKCKVENPLPTPSNPPSPPKKSTPSAAPTTPIIPPVIPSSAESIESCPATPDCPDLKSLGVEDKSSFLPDCVYYEGTLSEKCCGCRNVNVLVDFLAVTANWIFGITGGMALLVFVYGGFVILTAAGGERVKKGKDIIVAAVIGLIIIFTAQVGLKFILSALLKPAPTEKPASAPATLEGLNIKVKE